MKTPNPSSVLFSDLIETLEQKAKSLEAFLALTNSLRERLIAQEWSGIEGLLKQRQDLTFAVDQMDVRIRVLRAKQPPDAEGLPDAEGKRILDLLNAISGISEKARTLDRECAGLMADWREQTRGRLSTMRSSFKAVHGYNRKPVRPPKFLDVRR
jgi:hypothetical protein